MALASFGFSFSLSLLSGSKKLVETSASLLGTSALLVVVKMFAIIQLVYHLSLLFAPHPGLLVPLSSLFVLRLDLFLWTTPALRSGS